MLMRFLNLFLLKFAAGTLQTMTFIKFTGFTARTDGAWYIGPQLIYIHCSFILFTRWIIYRALYSDCSENTMMPYFRAANTFSVGGPFRPAVRPAWSYMRHTV